MKIDLNKYMGKWYEIARIANDFQPNMNNVVAEYIPNIDGTITVINTGYINGQRKRIIGQAINIGHDDLLKVSFDNNIYSDYKILAIDENYQYALVVGENENFLWILSRMPYIDKTIYDKFIDIANKNGFNTDKLIINE